MNRHVICKTHELPPGTRRIVEIAGRSIGIFNVDGTYYALRNSCPHQQAPLCLGAIGGTTEPAPPGEYRWSAERKVIRCPWHGWEFDLATGQSVFDPHHLAVRRYPVTIEPPPCHEPCSVEHYDVTVINGDVVLHL